jgi:adenosylcobinamide-GDP ribazoletransferase
VVAVVLVVLGDWAALSGMAPLRALAALLAGAAMARLAVVCVLVWLPYVRPEGVGIAARGARPLGDVVVAGLTAALPLALDWRHGVLAAVLVALCTVGLAALARARVGGATGDVYGAVVEVGQLAALVSFAVRL